MLPGKTEWRFWAEFRLFSAHFSPIFQRWYPICRFSAHNPCYKLKHGTPSAIFLLTCLRILPIFCICSARFPPIFRLTFCSFSTGPVLQGCQLLLIVNLMTITSQLKLHKMSEESFCSCNSLPSFLSGNFLNK